jgi:hypothetical protein
MPTHHDPTSSLKPSTKRNHDSTIISTTFSTASVNNCRAIQPRGWLLYSQKLPRHSFAAAAVKGHERPPAVHKYSEPFRVQSTVKSVTDPAIVACYRS